VRFGLDAVKGVGYAAVEGMKRAREEGGPFTSLWDFCARIDSRAVNKKAIEALIKCGAFGSTGDSRKGMLAVLEQAQASGQKAQQDAQIGQGSIFDLDDGADSSTPAQPSHAPIPAGEFERTEMLALEKESIGLFISAHPLKEIAPAMRAATDYTLTELAGRRDGDWVTVGGMITQPKKIKTKKGDFMMFATLDDIDAQVELVVFGKTLDASGDALMQDSIVLVRGKVEHKDRDKTCIVVQQIDPFTPSDDEVEKAREEEAKPSVGAGSLRLHLDAAALPARVLTDLKDVLSEFPGETDVVIELVTSVGRRRLKLGADFRVSRDASLHAELDDLLGAALLSPELVVGEQPAVAAG
jgi:DNA polymerase-3 subunit alpha